ncbi:MFS transporter [Lactiplantibacillus fabifermentans]|uniref:Transport protein n=2 Tax=Lactiplantibacillus fabifermentans TaxID=483011 RepID=A0A0R2NGX0_9LACO|nr:MFS transporter [Lactiplantibacillus fabifermentans]ETY75392.1 MFS transporter [Lactiplantibacillus fabifermentans T30PCM01]KRO25070.1 transport protein [Lactiplantibacillus fabifermentans DSM 21115]
MAQPRPLTTLSILSLSTVSAISTVITGVIPALKTAFPTVATTWIELVVTIANFSALATLLANPRLTARFGIRKVVISGLLLSAIAGCGPLLDLSFAWLMVSRLLLGLGIGLFSPHAISLIAHTYHGEQRARLLGYQTGLSALGNAVLLSLAGILIGSSWHHVFWLYAVLAVIAGLVWWTVPEPAVPTTTVSAHAQLPRYQWGLIGLTFVTYLLIYGVQLKLPSLFTERQLGSSQVLNLTLAAMNIGGFVAGMTFGQLHRHLHRFTLTLGYAGAALSGGILLVTKSAPLAIAAAIFFNFIYSYTGPYLVFTSNQGLASAQINTLSSYLTVATIISAFAAPLVWNALGQIGPATLTNNVLAWTTGCLTLIAIITLFMKGKPADVH